MARPTPQVRLFHFHLRVSRQVTYILSSAIPGKSQEKDEPDPAFFTSLLPISPSAWSFLLQPFFFSSLRSFRPGILLLFFFFLSLLYSRCISPRSPLHPVFSIRTPLPLPFFLSIFPQIKLIPRAKFFYLSFGSFPFFPTTHPLLRFYPVRLASKCFNVPFFSPALFLRALRVSPKALLFGDAPQGFSELPFLPIFIPGNRCFVF